VLINPEWKNIFVALCPISEEEYDKFVEIVEIQTNVVIAESLLSVALDMTKEGFTSEAIYSLLRKQCG
jgi:hypothetical protein